MTSGAENNIVLVYAQKHNMTVNKIIDEEGQWGEIFENSTGYGVLGKLVMDEADLAYGNVRQKIKI